MALVKEAILRLQVEGFQAAENAAGSLARSFEAAQKSATAAGSQAGEVAKQLVAAEQQGMAMSRALATASAGGGVAAQAAQTTARELGTAAVNAGQAATQVQRLGEAARTASAAAQGVQSGTSRLGSSLSRAATIGSLGATILGGATESPLLTSAARVVNFSSQGAMVGGPWGALAGGLAGIGLTAYEKLTLSDKEAEKARKLELKAEIHMNRDSMREAARQASEDLRRILERDLEAARDELFGGVGRAPRLSR